MKSWVVSEPTPGKKAPNVTASFVTEDLPEIRSTQGSAAPLIVLTKPVSVLLLSVVGDEEMCW